MFHVTFLSPFPRLVIVLRGVFQTGMFKPLYFIVAYLEMQLRDYYCLKRLPIKQCLQLLGKMDFDCGVISFGSCESPQYYLDGCYFWVLLAKI